MTTHAASNLCLFWIIVHYNKCSTNNQALKQIMHKMLGNYNIIQLSLLDH